VIDGYVSKCKRFISIWPILITFRLVQHKHYIEFFYLKKNTFFFTRINLNIYLASLFQGRNHHNNRYILLHYHSPKILHCTVFRSLRSYIFSWAIKTLVDSTIMTNLTCQCYILQMYHNVRSIDIIRICISW